MRVRASNPHNLPPRLYERQSKRGIAWWVKSADGTTEIVRAVPPSATPEQIAAARAAAIQQHSMNRGKASANTRQPRPEADEIAAWIANQGIADPRATRLSGGLPTWALKLYQSSQRRAEQRGILWTLKKSEFAEIATRAAGICEVSGIAMSLTVTGKKGPYGPSIDRIVSTEGYTATNVRLVCVAINFALNSWGLAAFLPIAEALVLKHSHSKN